MAFSQMKGYSQEQMEKLMEKFQGLDQQGQSQILQEIMMAIQSANQNAQQ